MDIAALELPVSRIADTLLPPNLLFGSCERFEVEVGFSNAHFLSARANACPRSGFLGIERKRKYFMRGGHILSRRLSQDNVRLINYDAYSVIRELIPLQCVDLFHIYFPDPWPKKKHHDNRFIRTDTLLMLHNRLTPGGRVVIATDHAGYAAFIHQSVFRLAPLFTRHPMTADDRGVMTKWEKRKISEGYDITYFNLERRS